MSSNHNKVLVLLLVGILLVSFVTLSGCTTKSAEDTGAEGGTTEGSSGFLGLNWFSIANSPWTVAVSAFAISFALFWLGLSMGLKGKAEEKTLKVVAALFALGVGIGCGVSSTINTYWRWAMFSGVPIFGLIALVAVVGLIFWSLWAPMRERHKEAVTAKTGLDVEKAKGEIEKESKKVEKAARRMYKFDVQVDKNLGDTSEQLTEALDEVKEIFKIPDLANSHNKSQYDAHYSEVMDKLQEANKKANGALSPLDSTFKWALALKSYLKEFKDLPIAKEMEKALDSLKTLMGATVLNASDIHQDFRDNICDKIDEIYQSVIKIGDSTKITNFKTTVKKYASFASSIKKVQNDLRHYAGHIESFKRFSEAAAIYAKRGLGQ